MAAIGPERWFSYELHEAIYDAVRSLYEIELVSTAYSDAIACFFWEGRKGEYA